MASCTCARLNRLRAFILASNDYCGESTHPINLQDSTYYHAFINSIDPDQLASQKPADQDQHCLVLFILTSQVGCGELHMFMI